MANDLNLNDPRLRDPIGQIPDGLQDPVQDKTPGFFQSIRNPHDLMLEESLPASLYQWITGNTKKKQAQEALEFIRNNPHLAGTRVYQEAERKLQRFGYLLEEGPMHVDLKEVGNMIKKNPKLFGAELVNMLMADPWLMFMPLGWGRLGRGVVNAIKMKAGKRLKYVRLGARTADDFKVGALATLGTPFVFSTVWQGSEDRTLDPKRTTVETTIGATAGVLFSVGFAGMGELASRLTRVPRQQGFASVNKILKKYADDPEQLTKFNENGIYKSVDELIEEIKNQAKVIRTPGKTVKISDKEHLAYEGIKAEITSALRDINQNATDMSWAAALKIPATFAAIGGTAQFLTADDDKLLATAKGAAIGTAIWGAGKIFLRKVNKVPEEFSEAALSTEASLDTMKLITVKLNSAAQELSNVIKQQLPDGIDSRRKVFYYLTKARGKWNKDTSKFEFNNKGNVIPDNELTKAELAGAKEIEKIFNKYYDIFGKESGLINTKRSHYLPLLWNEYNSAKQPFRFVDDFDLNISGPSGKFQFGRNRMFDDINRGFEKLNKDGKPAYTIRDGMDDPAELIRIYATSGAKALATRALITNLERTNINGKPLLYRSVKKVFSDESNYTEFKHPYLDVDQGTTMVHKGMIKSLRMVFDATDEPQLMGALFTTNLMMKRLAVGFSFFHAGALIESLIFAGSKWNTIKNIINPRTKPDLLKSVKDPNFFLKDHDNAIKVLNQHGYSDIVRFAQGSGLQISVPEDVGFDRFYYNVRGLDKFLKRHFGVSTDGKVENVFKWFDRITWDRVFTAAKLNTFLTTLNNSLDPATDKTLAQVYKKATQAATFSNDAFGGQNWEQIANRIQTPWLKSLMQTTFAPGSRGYMQLLLFAPDWTLSNIRIIAKSLPAFESDPQLRRLYQYYFARAALTYATAGTALNYIFSGQSLLENTDPTRINLGNGEVLTFSKQLMEPFHWITAPQSTGLKKIGALPRVTIEVLTNKKYLTTKWSPNITKKDDEAIEKGLKIGGQVGKRFLPIWLQTASQNIAEGLERDGLSADLAWDTAVDFVLGQSGHPRYQGPRYTQYKTKGLVRSPYETLF